MAQDEDGDGAALFPTEIYSCSFNEGNGEADLGQWVAKWNAWADSAEIKGYSAWTLYPFYFGDNQEFDFIWLGASASGEALGRAHDSYLSSGGELEAGINAIATCDSHSNFAALTIKQPPPGNEAAFAMAFADCNLSEGTSFDDIYPAMKEWAAYMTESGSKTGAWVLFPAFGGGKVEYAFKSVATYANYEALGVDYDTFNNGGYKKNVELFGDRLVCDVQRVYNAVQRRNGMADDS